MALAEKLEYASKLGADVDQLHRVDLKYAARNIVRFVKDDDTVGEIEAC